MNRILFTVKLKPQYENMFIRYMRLFNAHWQSLDTKVIEKTAWEGDSVELSLFVAAPVYYRMYNLLCNFVALTSVEMLVDDHSDNPEDKVIEPYLLRAQDYKKARALLWFVREVAIYKKAAVVRRAKRLKKALKISARTALITHDQGELPF